MNMRWTFACATVLAVMLSTGCATKGYVKRESQATHTRIDDVSKQVESNQTSIRSTNERVDEANRRIDETQQDAQAASKTAQEALNRAQEAGKLAEGKLLYEEVLTDDKVRFGVDQAALSDTAKAALDEFAGRLTAENKGVYIEIQGHTDSVGPETYNEKLGLARAESVRGYLNKAHRVPLHRIAVISYGEAEPIDDNSTRAGRSQNRRVVLVVLR